MKVKSLIHARLLATPWTAAYQAPPSMGFSRQEDWSGVPLPSLAVRVKVTFKIEVRIKFRVEDRPRLGVNSEKAMAPHSSTLA